MRGPEAGVIHRAKPHIGSKEAVCTPKLLLLGPFPWHPGTCVGNLPHPFKDFGQCYPLRITDFIPQRF